MVYGCRDFINCNGIFIMFVFVRYVDDILICWLGGCFVGCFGLLC